MIQFALDSVQTVLCFGAHADDIEIGCGGAILKLLERNENLDVFWIVLSGFGDREAEARHSAELFLSGTKNKSIQINQFPDTLFPYNGEKIKAYFNELGRLIAPDVVFTHRLEDRHQDHRLVAELTWNTFRDHLIFEYEIPKYEGDLGSPNVYVPLTEAICERKVDIIVKSFSSQTTKKWFCAETFWAMLRVRGIESDSQSQFAEGLYCRKLVI